MLEASTRQLTIEGSEVTMRQSERHRGYCRVCGREVTRCADGTAGKHSTFGDVGVCPGSRQPTERPRIGPYV
jgi:hypothetical protein